MITISLVVNSSMNAAKQLHCRHMLGGTWFDSLPSVLTDLLWFLSVFQVNAGIVPRNRL